MKNEQYRIFANNLTRQLADHHKTQSDLAKHLDVSTAAVAYWCTGQKMPRMDKIQAICDFLYIKKTDLLDENNSEDEQILVELHKMNPEIKKHLLEYIRLLNKNTEEKS